jgi:hypothetical protein
MNSDEERIKYIQLLHIKILCRYCLGVLGFWGIGVFGVSKTPKPREYSDFMREFSDFMRRI